MVVLSSWPSVQSRLRKSRAHVSWYWAPKLKVIDRTRAILEELRFVMQCTINNVAHCVKDVNTTIFIFRDWQYHVGARHRCAGPRPEDGRRLPHTMQLFQYFRMPSVALFPHCQTVAGRVKSQCDERGCLATLGPMVGGLAGVGGHCRRRARAASGATYPFLSFTTRTAAAGLALDSLRLGVARVGLVGVAAMVHGKRHYPSPAPAIGRRVVGPARGNRGSRGETHVHPHRFGVEPYPNAHRGHDPGPDVHTLHYAHALYSRGNFGPLREHGHAAPQCSLQPHHVHRGFGCKFSSVAAREGLSESCGSHVRALQL